MRRGLINSTPRRASPCRTAIYIGLNIFFSIIIILLNKWIYVHIGFPNITMSCIHFMMTSFGLLVCRYCGMFNPVRISLRTVLQLSVCFCGFVSLTNLSLQSNTVGTFQLLKTLTMPTIVMIQIFVYRQTFPLNLLLSLLPVMFGVFLNSYYDLNFNALGMTYAMVAVAITSWYQVLVGEKQKELQVSSMQLLWYQAPMSVLLLMIAVIIFEPPMALFEHSWSAYDISMVLITAFVAFILNVSTYWIIGNTSPVAYNVIGQLKFCLTLLGGYLLFDDPVQIIQLLGILITLIGVLIYTHMKMSEIKRRENERLDRVVFDTSKI